MIFNPYEKKAPSDWTARRSVWPILFVAVSGGLLLYAFLPSGITAMGDDFGYLNTVVETIRRGRPWTDAWLEPWSASLAVLTSFVFHTTGNLPLSVAAVQSMGGASTAAGIYILTREGGLRLVPSLAAVLLGLSFPTVLWKSVEFTGMVLYLPALIWAIWAAKHRKWLAFSFLWILALATRQSAIVWGAIPCWELIKAWPTEPRKSSEKKKLVGTLLFGALALAILSIMTNPTHAQETTGASVLHKFKIAAATHHFLVGAGLWISATGLAALVFGRFRPAQFSQQSCITRLLFVLLLGLGLFASLMFQRPVYEEHYSFSDQWGRIYLAALFAVGFASWAVLYPRPNPAFSLAALASLSLVCLRRDVWDYYFLDVVLLSFFGLSNDGTAVPHKRTGQLAQTAVATALLGLLAWQSRFAFRQKCRIDQEYAICRLTEQALRDGKLAPDQIGHAPFGFMGWHLHHHYIAHDYYPGGIAGFVLYQRPSSAELYLGPMRTKDVENDDVPDHSRVLENAVFRVAWIHNQRIALLRSVASSESAKLKLDLAKYQNRPFPLSNEEWLAHIQSER